MAHRKIIFFLLVIALVLFPMRYATAAATFSFSPDSSTIAVGENISIDLELSTGGDAINAAEANLTFPILLIEATGITEGSLFSYWPEDPTYSNATGNVSFAGGLPDPGFNGTNGGVLTLSFHAISTGTANICLTSGRILANDGNGSNIIGPLGCAVLTIVEADVPDAPSVTSSTHPDENTSYPSNDPELAWNLESGVTGFSYILDQIADTIPDDATEGLATETSYADLADGVWYFHIKAQNSNGWGATRHFTIRIASGTPLAPSVTSSTHPDPNAWYQEPDPAFAWETAEGITGYSYLLDETSNTIPDDISEGASQSISFSDLADGVWYFHIKAENQNGWGATTHFRIQIDRLPPVVSASLVDGSPTKDTTPDIFIDAFDATSGIAGISIYVDGEFLGTFALSDTQPFTLPELSVGTHEIIVVALDDAGNEASITISLTIEAKTIIDRITDSVRNLIPQEIRDTVRDITKPINEAIETLRDSETIQEITTEIVEPISRAAAAIGVAAAVATLPVGLINALFAFLRFGYLFLSPIFFRKRRKPWGVVIDSFTKRPIKGAIVRIFQTEFNKMKESQITDDFGRFGFLVDPGSYTISVNKDGYTFPSKLTHADFSFADLYSGGVITIDDKTNPNITVSIPLDPISEHISHRAILWKRFRDVVALFLERVNWPLLGIGTGVSVWAAVIAPSTLNSLLLVLYMLLVVMKIIQQKLTFKSYGIVLDKETKKPIDLAVVRIFNAETSTMVTTRITNQVGRFSALVRPGSYYLMVTKPPYKPTKTDPIKLSKSQSLSIDVQMEKGTLPDKAVPPTPPPLVPPTPVSNPTEEAPQAVSQPPTPPPLADEITQKNQKG